MNYLKEKILEIFRKNLPGYRQIKNRFYEHQSELVKGVEVQFLKIGSNKFSFTIHFAIWVPEIHNLVFGDDSFDFKEAGMLNGVFNCNIHDIICAFKCKPKIKYWDLENDAELFKEIQDIITNYLLPFAEKIKSLNDLNRIIEDVEHPFKQFANTPVLILGLKYLLGRDEEFYAIAKKLKSKDEEYFGPSVDRLVNKKKFD